MRYGTDLTQVQFKFGYKPVMLYTDPACTQEYDPNSENVTIDLYVNEWEDVTYTINVRLAVNFAFHEYEEFGHLWDKLEEQGVTVTRNDETHSVTLSVKYDSGAKMPGDDELTIPVDLMQYAFDFNLNASVYEAIPDFDGTFDSLFIGEMTVPPLVGGTTFMFVRDRGGTPYVDGAPRMIYTQADLKEMVTDVALGYRNFKLANDIALTEDFGNVDDDIVKYANGDGIMLDGLNEETDENFTISGLVNKEGVGLFEVLPGGSRISNLTLDNFSIDCTGEYITAYEGIGLLVNVVEGDITLDNVKVTNSSITYDYVASGSIDQYIGGIVGQCVNANLKDCTVESSVSLTSTSSKVIGFGAFIGQATGTAVSKDNCINNTSYNDIAYYLATG